MKHTTPTRKKAELTTRPRRPRPPLLQRVLFYLGIFGPGLIAANAGNDPGGIATYSSMGAQFGYSMLWVMVILTVGMGLVQEMCTRMGVVTGKGLSDLIRENFPLRLTVFIMFVFLLANGGVIVSEFIGVAAALNLFGIPSWIGAPCGGLLIWLLVARGSYKHVEKIFLALTFVFFAYIFSAFLAKPDWGAVAVGTFIPTIRPSGSYILMIVAAVGTTISPYMQLYVQSAVVEKGIGMHEYRYERFEVWVGAIFSNTIAFFIIVSTAATLFVASHGVGVPISSAAEAAQALAPFLGIFASRAFAVGMLGAALLAAGVLPLSTSYSLSEAFGFERGVGRAFHEAPFFWGLFTLLIILGVIVAMLPNLPVIQILLNLYLLNGLLLPIILFAILYLVNQKRLMGRYTNRLIYNVLSYALTILVSGLAALYLLTQVLGFFGIQLFR
ncbi:Nramp family divalent metal transporter [Dictyobacter formicarum]|uniref:Mn transporter n=1 Tax=Dictyobacter formicarum TaxID=2778368 RepID=A0ABQ3VDQ5_9CHLR|nr:Nramp family divalent metal transporter [Dictyobacter formicarum]GHO84052.1 Mn transporter [Dictyobacter formicarum]